jgi:hypothetical protein
LMSVKKMALKTQFRTLGNDLETCMGFLRWWFPPADNMRFLAAGVVRPSQPEIDRLAEADFSR